LIEKSFKKSEQLIDYSAIREIYFQENFEHLKFK